MSLDIAISIFVDHMYTLPVSGNFSHVNFSHQLVG